MHRNFGLCLKYYDITLNSCGDCFVFKGSKNIGLYSWEGRLLIPCEYSAVKPVEDNPYYIIAGNWKKSKNGVYDRSGKEIVPPIYYYVFAHNNKSTGEVFFKVRGAYGKEGAYNSNGRLIVPIKYEICLILDNYIEAIPNAGSDDYYIYDFDGNILEKNVKPRKSTSSGWGGQIYFDPNAFMWMAPAWNTPVYTPVPETNNSTVHGTNPRETLNQTVGEYCLTCKGTGKCHACNGTKVASGFGHTYKCTVCDEHGNCPSCNGTGKASWNR